MKNILSHFVVGFCRNMFLRMPRPQAVSFLMTFVRVYVGKLSPDEALRFLFDLDARLYSLQGQMSVQYDHGVHTKHRHMRYHDFFVNRVARGESVLDLGCGQGAVAYDLAKKGGCKVVGIDLEEKNIAMAKEKHSHPDIEYIVGDVLHSLPARTYDVVVLSNVLEHLDGRSDFLSGVARVTSARRFLIRVPLFERDWRVPLKKELGVEWRLDPTHQTEYTLESFDEEIRNAGMSIVHQEVRWGEVWAEAVVDAA